MSQDKFAERLKEWIIATEVLLKTRRKVTIEDSAESSVTRVVARTTTPAATAVEATTARGLAEGMFDVVEDETARMEAVAVEEGEVAAIVVEGENSHA